MASTAWSNVHVFYHNWCMKSRANGWFIFVLISNSHLLTKVIWWLVSSQVAIIRAKIHMSNHGLQGFSCYLSLSTKVCWPNPYSMEISLPWCSWQQIAITKVRQVLRKVNRSTYLIHHIIQLKCSFGKLGSLAAFWYPTIDDHGH